MLVPDVSFVTTGHDVSDARLHRLAGTLVEAGLVVEVLGLGDAADGPEGALTRTAPRRGRLARAVAALRTPVRARGRVLISLDPDAAIGCAIATPRRRRGFVSDVHEDYVLLLHDRDWARGPAGAIARLLLRIADVANRRADLVVVADEHIGAGIPGRRLVVRNLPVRAHLPDVGTRDREPRAIYVGDIRRSRGLVAMLEALERAPAWTLDLVGPVAAADESWLLQWQQNHPDVDARIRWHGRLPPRRAWQLAAGAWAGFSLLEPTRAFVEAMPTKVYEYLACGVPVITTSLPRPAVLVEQSGAGAVADDPDEVARVLTRWSTDPREHDRVRDRAIDWSHEGRDPYQDFVTSISEIVGGHR